MSNRTEALIGLMERQTTSKVPEASSLPIMAGVNVRTTSLSWARRICAGF